MIFKNDGEEVNTVSKLLIIVFALVKVAKIKAHMATLWSPRLPTTIFLDKNGNEFARVLGEIDFTSEMFLKFIKQYI